MGTDSGSSYEKLPTRGAGGRRSVCNRANRVQTRATMQRELPGAAIRPRGQKAKMPRCQDAKMPRGQDAKMPRCQDAKMPRGQEAKMPRCQDAKMPRGQEAKMPRCHNAKMPRGQDAKMPRCQDAKMPRCQGITLSSYLATKPETASVS